PRVSRLWLVARRHAGSETIGRRKGEAAGRPRTGFRDPRGNPRVAALASGGPRRRRYVPRELNPVGSGGSSSWPLVSCRWPSGWVGVAVGQPECVPYGPFDGVTEARGFAVR